MISMTLNEQLRDLEKSLALVESVTRKNGRRLRNQQELTARMWAGLNTITPDPLTLMEHVDLMGRLTLIVDEVAGETEVTFNITSGPKTVRFTLEGHNLDVDLAKFPNIKDCVARAVKDALKALKEAINAAGT